MKADNQVNPYHLIAIGPNCIAIGSISGIIIRVALFHLPYQKLHQEEG